MSDNPSQHAEGVRERFIVSLDSDDMAADMLALWDAVRAIFPDRRLSIGYADRHLNVGTLNDGIIEAGEDVPIPTADDYAEMDDAWEGMRERDAARNDGDGNDA